MKKLMGVLMMCAAAFSCTGATEREAVVETVNRLFIETDNRNWSAVKGLFAEEVLFDVTSMAGGSAQKMKPDAIVGAWDRGLKDIKAIHHQAGNYLVKIAGSGADVFCYGIALHYLPNKTGRNLRAFVGSYDFHLVKAADVWKIDKFKFNLKYIDGNPNLERDAR